MWLALAAAAFFSLIVLVTLLRAEKSVANGALTVITLLAIGVAAAATLRGSDPAEKATVSVSTMTPAPQVTAALPALSCLDDLAGDMVLAACEKVVFGSADAVAAAVSISATRLDRLAALGDVASANKVMTPELQAMRRAMERDRYGLIAYVLQSRDHCMPDSCAAYAVFTDHKQIASNMDERVYEGLVTRYAPGWNVPAVAAAATGAAVQSNPALAGLPVSVPTGKPTTADFPSAASIPPISIMTDTPLGVPKTPPASANAQAAPRPAPARKQAAPKAAARPQAPTAAAPVQLAPEGAQADR
jgi:hypothetical protein